MAKMILFFTFSNTPAKQGKSQEIAGMVLFTLPKYAGETRKEPRYCMTEKIFCLCYQIF
jgi:hypothetical protein